MQGEKIDAIIGKIAALRTKKGFSFENMAHELSITPSAYRKVETGETKLTVERLFQIVEILETSLSDILEIEKEVFQQNNSDNATGYLQKIENFYQDNKDTYEKLLKSKDEQIALLKSLLDKKLFLQNRVVPFIVISGYLDICISDENFVKMLFFINRSNKKS